jgi:hypothetical protein
MSGKVDMTTLKSEQNFSFGKVTTEISVSGPARNPDWLADHAQATLMGVSGVQFIQSGVIRDQVADGTMKMNFDDNITADDITLRYKLTYDFKRQVSRSKINRIVLGEILPSLNRVISTHVADEATEQEALTPQPTSLVRDTTSFLVGTSRLPRSLTELYSMSDDELGSTAGRSGQRTLQHA